MVEPMGGIPQAARTFDGNLELRDVADGAETATANETAVNIEVRKQEAFECIVYVTAIDSTTGNETYVFHVDVSDAVDGTFVVVATLPDIGPGGTNGGTGVYRIPLSGKHINDLDADADWIRVGCTLGGATPSITYGAYLAPAKA